MPGRGRIELIIGPMFAGKTSELLRRLRRHHYGRKQCLVVKAAKDDRYSKACVSSHDKQQMQATSCKQLFELRKEAAPYHVIGIDEGQFFPDLRDFAEWAANCGKIVIIAALDGDFKRQPFGDVCSLIPMAEKVDKLSAVCMMCQNNEASFSHRICASTEVELVGGADKYVAACRECYMSSQYAKNESPAKPPQGNRTVNEDGEEPNVSNKASPSKNQAPFPFDLGVKKLNLNEELEAAPQDDSRPVVVF